MASETTLVQHLDRLVTMDAQDRELTDAYVVSVNGAIAAVGSGDPPEEHSQGQVIDGRGLVALPGLVNTHHHFFQTLTRVLPAAQDCRILDWMAANYPYWAKIDEEAVYDTARVAVAELLLSGCSTSSDHLYAFPKNSGSPLQMLSAEITAAAELGMRFHPTRGAVDVSIDAGGSPPKELVEDTDSVLASMEEALRRFHDPAAGSMCRLGLSPNSLTICTPRLMEESAALARRHGLTLHTHVAEVIEEEEYCLEVFGKRPLERLADLGWVAQDVWLAHVVHVDEIEIGFLAERGCGVAHCPTSNMRLASGMAPLYDMLDAKVAVGLGVDGSASNDTGNVLAEARQALLLSRVRERDRLLSARQALRIATVGGASVLKRDDIGQVAVGMQADIAMYRLAGVSAAGAEHDPVAALVMGQPPRVHHLLVKGRFAVKDGELARTSEQEIVARHRKTVRRLVG